jgi:hypothetical protein
LRSPDPLDLLIAVSGLLDITDARSRDPFTTDQPRTDRADLIESFIGTSYAETTAALTVMQAMLPDELSAARIGRELASRKQPLPEWVRALPAARAEPELWFLTHVLGDGDDYLFGVTLPSGHALSALVYVDHNLGTVVKDAFVVPEPLEVLALKVGSTLDDPDQSLTRIDAATGRAVVEAAIEHGARMYPPLSSDSWPVCRPLVEWLLRHLPEGGVAPTPKEWTDEEIRELADDFFASPFGAPLDREDERGLFDSVVWFGTSYATGDPLRWSAVTVELLLADWMPRKVVAEPAYLAKVPDLVRAYIRYCHHRLGIRPSLTDEALAAVDEYEPDYQRAIRSKRLQGPDALLARMFDSMPRDDDDLTSADVVLESLDRKAGGRLQLQSLDADPLPDEPFVWAGIADDIRPVVQEILDACDRCAAELLDVEHRTAMRRFLSRAAVADPAIFRRKASPSRGAAAVAWVIARANESVGFHSSRLEVQELLAWFGVNGSVSQRAEPFLRANGVDPSRLYGEMDLGAPDLLTSERREALITSRDYWLDQ